MTPTQEAGLKLVPTEPTEAMIEAAANAPFSEVRKATTNVYDRRMATVADLLRAGIAAAPSPEPMQADLRETIPQDAVDAGVSAWHDAGGLLDDRCRAGVRAALAAMQAKSEPVAWRFRDHPDNGWVYTGLGGRHDGCEVQPLFAHPSPSDPNPDLVGLVERLNEAVDLLRKWNGPKWSEAADARKSARRFVERFDRESRKGSGK